MKKRYISLFVCAGLGDILGTNILTNVQYKINTQLDYTNKIDWGEVILEYINHFIDNGGINNFKFEDGINLSADILYLISQSQSDNNIDSLKDSLINIYKQLVKEKNSKNRIYYISTFEIISKLLKDKNYSNIDNNYAIDVCIRTMYMGLIYSQENELDKLIDISIKNSRLTHNNIIGFLSGMATAYFVSLAVRNIKLEKWIYMLISLLESDTIKKYIDFKDTTQIIDYVTFLRGWQNYNDTKFMNNKTIKTQSTINLIYRLKYKATFFINEKENAFYECSNNLLQAYDSVLDCNGKWEKLVYYALLLPISKQNSLGALTCGLYGIIYGTDDIPKYMLKNVKSLNILQNLGEIYFEKYAIK